MMGDGMDWGMAMMIAMIVATLLFIVLAAVGVIWLARSLRGERGGANRDLGGPPTALRALERRYADGEIDADEYRERRSVLERDG